MPIEQRHLHSYEDLFIHRRDLYTRQVSSGSYFLKRQPVTHGVIRSHLEGLVTAGWYGLQPDSTLRWVVLDADRDDGLEQLQQAWGRLNDQGISSQLELSRRGGHLWVLFEPIPARAARRLILSILPGLDVEVFPKQDRLDEGRVGSAVRGPLGIHRRSGERYPFVEPTSLRPIAESISATIEFLGSVRPIAAATVAEKLAVLLEEVGEPVNVEAPHNHGHQTVRHIGGSAVEAIKERIGDPYTFISSYVELDSTGRGHCPFHPPDLHSSFVVNREHGYWVCFHEVNPRTGRYIGGDAIDFYRRLKGITTREAVSELKDRV